MNSYANEDKSCVPRMILHEHLTNRQHTEPLRFYLISRYSVWQLSHGDWVPNWLTVD